MKISTVTKLANSEAWRGVTIGNNLEFVADKDRIFDPAQGLFGEYRWKNTGKLTIVRNLFTFCYGDFAKIFRMKAAEVRKLFRENSIYNVRITIEILDEEEWEYTK